MAPDFLRQFCERQTLLLRITLANSAEQQPGQRRPRLRCDKSDFQNRLYNWARIDFDRQSVRDWNWETVIHRVTKFFRLRSCSRDRADHKYNSVGGLASPRPPGPSRPRVFLPLWGLISPP